MTREQRQPAVRYRRRPRRRARGGLALAVLAVLVLATGGIAYAWVRATTHPAPSPIPSQAQPIVRTRPTAGPSVSIRKAAPKPGSKGTASTSQATTTRSGDPVADAAVRFPGAPAVTPIAINHLQPKHKYIAITLDDGYGFQPEMLALLRKYDARCTTFLLGGWMANNTASVRQIKDAGFEIANHTYDHKTLTKLSDAQIVSELDRTQRVISAVTGNQAPYMRPPGGGTDDRVKRIAADLGYKTILWDRTFADSSKHASADNSYHWVMEWGGGVKPGDIILCHWGSRNTLAAMQRILPELKAQGFEFVTLSQLIADSSPVTDTISPRTKKATTSTVSY